MSGRRDSNPRPSAWKANALSTELLPQICGGQGWIRTTEGVSQQIYSLPHLATLVLAQQYFKKRAEDGAQTRDPQLGRLMLYQLSYFRNFLWAKMDSNHRRRKPADLQSAPFGHSGICPSAIKI